MGVRLQRFRNRSFQRAFFATWAVVASSPLFFLTQGSYPLVSVISLLLVLAPLPLAFIAGFAATLGRLGRTLIAYAIAAAAVTLHCQWDSEIAVVLLYLAAATFGLFVYFRNDVPVGVMAVVFGTVALLSPLTARPLFSPAPPPIPESDLAPLIHIILDEHGPGGFEDFAHWPNAYARFFHTINSVEDIMEGYPERLEEIGYDVEVWDIGYPSICLDRCATYDPASFALIDELPLIEQASIIRDMYLGSRLIFPTFESFPNRSSPLNGRRAFQKFAERTKAMKNGEAIIFHAMLPHGPWILDEHCEVKPFEKWTYRTHSFLEQSRVGYEGQRSCTEKLVKDSIRDDAIVILHGDHSNRLQGRDPMASLTDLRDDELRGALTTLFAVRFPDASVTGSAEQVSVRSLLRSFEGSSDFEGERETVWLEDEDWVPAREVEIPPPPEAGRSSAGTNPTPLSEP